MHVTRRNFLRVGAATATAVAVPARVDSEAPTPEKSKGMLFDATRCIGCLACQGACREKFEMPPTPDESGLHDQPKGLSAKCASIIKLYRSEDGREWSFIREQCMHCLDPACASACLVKALEKTPEGPVIYHESKCMGCRYCMIACPFDIPRFEYEKAVPAIRKCPFCYKFVSRGEAPRCVKSCPTGALMFGGREELLEEGRSRIYGEPERYVHHIYGEHEAGGTSVLFIAGVSFEKLGLPTNLPKESIPNRTKAFLNSVPLVIITWAAFCTGLRWFVERRNEVAGPDEGSSKHKDPQR